MITSFLCRQLMVEMRRSAVSDQPIATPTSPYERMWRCCHVFLTIARKTNREASIRRVALGAAVMIAPPLLWAAPAPGWIADPPNRFGGADTMCRNVAGKPLILPDGRHVYVEPDAVVASGSDLLIAGTNKSVWRPGMAREALSPSDSIFGVVVPEAASPWLLPALRRIAPERIQGVRVVGLTRGGWGVAWGVEKPGVALPKDDAESLWYAIVGDHGWRDVDSIPLPAGIQVSPYTSSSLVVVGDTVAWAVRVNSAGSSRRTVGFFLRVAGRWSYEEVPAPHVAYLDLAYAPDHGFVLAVVEPDTSETSDTNSLFLFVRERSGWRRQPRLARGGQHAIFRPSLDLASNPATTSWWAEERWDGRGRNAQYAQLDPLGGRAAPVLLDSQTVATASVSLGTRGHAWLIAHPLAGTAHEFRLWTLRGGRIASLGCLRSPFFAPVFGAAGLKSGDLVLVGPQDIRTPPDPYPTLLLLQVPLTGSRNGAGASVPPRPPQRRSSFP